ncbi:MAG: hypothetical protein AABW41_01625 [Nanoarchaeota archaeon]
MTTKKNLEHYTLKLGAGKHLGPSAAQKFYFRVHASNDSFLIGQSHAESLLFLAYLTCKVVHKDDSSKADTINVRNLEDCFNYEPLTSKELNDFKEHISGLEAKYNYGLHFNFDDYQTRHNK